MSSGCLGCRLRRKGWWIGGAVRVVAEQPSWSSASASATIGIGHRHRPSLAIGCYRHRYRTRWRWREAIVFGELLNKDIAKMAGKDLKKFPRCAAISAPPSFASLHHHAPPCLIHIHRYPCPYPRINLLVAHLGRLHIRWQHRSFINCEKSGKWQHTLLRIVPVPLYHEATIPLPNARRIDPSINGRAILVFTIIYDRCRRIQTTGCTIAYYYYFLGEESGKFYHLQ